MSLHLTLRPLANCLRALSIDAVEAAGSGHPGMPMGMADVATVLYARHLRFYPHNPHWADRDRVIFSGGHGSMLLYALNHLTGYAAMTMDEIKRFRQVGSRTPGHPEIDVEAGVEMTTGPLGQGLGAAVGFALAERILNAKFGDGIINHRTYVLCGDGDLQEGLSHEACALAGHLKLKNLIILYDDNGITIDGPTKLSFTEDVAARFRAYGWATASVDGHDIDALDKAMIWAKSQDQPVLLACKTTIGFGAPNKAGTADVHGSPLGDVEAALAKKELGWTFAPFEIPDGLRAKWREDGERCRIAYTQWEERLAALDDATRQTFVEEQTGINMAVAARAIHAVTEKFQAEGPNIATRKASQMVIDALCPALSNLIGGSADLTGSNLTLAKGARAIGAGDYTGTYIHYGVREHGMAAIMNGLALHGGLRPFGGTFLCFTDYLRPSLRLAALMHAPVIYVMTHDSIGLGEDGPTHQPVEHLASLRAIPNVRVFRPGDAVETAVCWAAALEYTDGPSVLCLSRQNLPCHSSIHQPEVSGYIVRDAGQAPDVVLVATGSEVSVAMGAADILAGQGHAVRVVSIPCFELFWARPEATRATILGPDTALRVGIEAGIRQSWDRIIGPNGIFVGMHGFGASGKASDLYQHFGMTPQAVADVVQKARS